jgi:hypothetical protein
MENFLETYGGYTLDDALEEGFGAILEMIRMKAKLEEEAKERAENESNQGGGLPPGAQRRP